MGSPEIRGELRVNRGTGVPGIGSSKTNKGGCFSSVCEGDFPQAKLFGLTTGEQVMRINTSLGYVPVTFAKLTDDESFGPDASLA